MGSIRKIISTTGYFRVAISSPSRIQDIDIQSDFFKSVALEAELSETDLRNNLLNTKIMAEENSRYIRFILPVVHMIFLDDGGMVASDDNDRLNAWLLKNEMSTKGQMVFINSDQLMQSFQGS